MSDEELEHLETEGEGEEIADDGGAEPVQLDDFARELGWASKDEWKGDPAKWRGADDFLRKTVKINQAMNAQQQVMRDQLSRIERTTSAMVDRVKRESYEQARREFNQAVEDGDHEAAFEIGQTMRQTEAAQPQTPPELQAFKERNKQWFQIDPVATNVAISIGEQFKHLPDAEQIERVEAEIQRRFPEYFEAQQKASTKAPPLVSEPARTARPVNRGKAKGFADMPPESRKMAEDFERRHGTPREEFAKEFWRENT